MKLIFVLSIGLAAMAQTVLTPQPGEPLRVSPNLTCSGGTCALPTGSNLSIGDTVSVAMLTVKGAGNTSATSALALKNSDGTGLMTVLNNGNVGIGTTGPWQALTIANPTVDTTLALGVSSGYAWTMIRRNNDGTLVFHGNQSPTSNDVLTMAPGGAVGIGYDAATSGTAGKLIINGNVGIGTTFPTGAPAAKLATVGSAMLYDPSTLGGEIAVSDATCTGWTLGAGWSCSSGVISHTSGTATATYTGYTPIAGNVYRLAFTAAGRTAGSVTPSIGGNAGASDSVATAATYDLYSTAATVLTLTPTTDFNGSITVTGAGQLSLKSPLGSTVSVNVLRHRPIVFANLGALTALNGDVVYCADCTYGARGDAASGSGTGVFLGYVNGAWKNQ